MTGSPAPAPGNRSIRLSVSLGVCGVILLIAIGVFLWTFFLNSAPFSVAPPDTLSGSQLTGAANSVPGELTVFLDKPGYPISPTLFGLALEEINHSLDGGLYAELLRNRTLVWSRAILGGKLVTTNGRTVIEGGQIITDPQFWSLDKSAAVTADMQMDTTPVPGTAAEGSLRLAVSSVGPNGRAALANPGYWGIPVRPDWTYHASFYAKAGDDFSGPLTLDIETDGGKSVYTQATIDRISRSWQRYDVDLKTDKNITPCTADRFVISTTGKGTVWLTEASLFPPTYNNRPNGNRIDLMQKLADLKPSFIIFPGGDTLDGRVVRFRFNWKNTIGPVEQRSAQPSTWERSSNGFGLMEFLLTCEDLHAQPVLAIYDGTSTAQHVAPGKDLQPYVQDALDEIEYVTGDKITTWGARRAADGHPDPFPLHYLQIGNNEQLYNQESYNARFTQFHDAIKAEYPQLQLIATTPVSSRRPDVIDEHFYKRAADFYRMTHRYDTYVRGGPKIFVGEWATREGTPKGPIPPYDRRSAYHGPEEIAPTPNLNAALGDFAWMTGLERNADIVIMNSYAPLLVNVNPGAKQWAINLIGYNAGRAYGSPSYYAQQMFNLWRGRRVVPASMDDTPGFFYSTSASRSADGAGTLYLKAVNSTGSPIAVEIEVSGASVAPDGRQIVLTSKSPDDTNTIEHPDQVVPATSPLDGAGDRFLHVFPAYSDTAIALTLR